MSASVAAIKDSVIQSAAMFHGLEARHIGGNLWSVFYPREDEPVAYMEYHAERSHDRWEAEVVCEQQEHFTLPPCDHVYDLCHKLATC